MIIDTIIIGWFWSICALTSIGLIINLIGGNR